MERAPTYQVSLSATRYVAFDRVARNRLHRHSFFEPCIVVSGAGEFEHGGQVFSLGVGDLFMADAGVFHEIRSLHTRDLGVYFLAFNVNRAGRPSRSRPQHRIDCNVLAEFMVRHGVYVPGQSHLIPLFEHAMQLWRRDENQSRSRFYDEAAQLLLDQIMAALTASARLSVADRGEQALTTRITEAIERHLHHSVRLATLAKECGVSERTLRRRWRAGGGASLPEEINRRRIARAAHLLLLPDMAIAEVGRQVGLESGARFSRVFRSIRSMTPKEYRRRFLGHLPGVAAAGAPRFRTEFVDGAAREYDS